ncbi:hypothetical protein Tco_0440406, partial [Tanacetum coccineum]
DDDSDSSDDDADNSDENDGYNVDNGVTFHQEMAARMPSDKVGWGRIVFLLVTRVPWGIIGGAGAGSVGMSSSNGSSDSSSKGSDTVSNLG